MQPLTIAKTVFDRVGKRVTKIQQSPRTALSLILRNHGCLDLTRSDNEVCQRLRVPGEQIGNVFFYPQKVVGIRDLATFA